MVECGKVEESRKDMLRLWYGMRDGERERERLGIRTTFLGESISMRAEALLRLESKNPQ